MTTYPNDVDWGRLTPYLTGDCPPTERTAIEADLAVLPIEQQAEVQRVQAVWISIGARGIPAQNPSDIWVGVASATRLPAQLVMARRTEAVRGQPEAKTQVAHPRIALQSAAKTAVKQPRLQGALPRMILNTLVGAAVLVLAVIVYPRLTERTPPNTVSFHERHTLPTQRAEITLADGSSILLGPDSRVRYSTDFGRSSRTVELTGQALFTVTTRTDQPFIVRTGSVATRVLGTSFTVRKYADDDSVQVVVAQGKVALGPTVLGTGDRATTMTGDRVDVVHDVNVATETAWTDGRLVLTEIPFAEAIPDLERWYGVRITVASPSLLNMPVVATLPIGSGRDALESLATVLRARVVFNGPQVTFAAR